MRIAHKNAEAHESPVERKNRLKQLEQDDPVKAVAGYEKDIKKKPLGEYSYDRLMIIFRKQRDYGKELGVIKRAIDAFEGSFADARGARNKTLARLSRSLLKSLNMTDKKGNIVYDMEPLNRWRKRKTFVENKLARAKR